MPRTRTLTFTFDLDEEFNPPIWTVKSKEGPGAVGVHAEPYEALMDCAFTLFDLIEDPDDAPKSVQHIYHQLNLDFHPYFPDNEEEEEIIEERKLSPVQQERAKRFMELLNG